MTDEEKAAWQQYIDDLTEWLGGVHTDTGSNGPPPPKPPVQH